MFLPGFLERDEGGGGEETEGLFLSDGRAEQVNLLKSLSSVAQEVNRRVLVLGQDLGKWSPWERGLGLGSDSSQPLGSRPWGPWYHG